MTNTLTVLALLLAISTASAQASASDALNKVRLSKANLSAIAATPTYAAQPNGTTHAIADLVFCYVSELRDEARESERATEADDKQIDTLKRLRVRVNLPAAECAATVIEFTNVQVTAGVRPFISAN